VPAAKTGKDIAGLVVLGLVVILIGGLGMNSSSGTGDGLAGRIAGLVLNKAEPTHKIQLLAGYRMLDLRRDGSLEDEVLADASVANLNQPMRQIPRASARGAQNSWVMWVNAHPVEAREGDAVTVKIITWLDGPLRCSIRQDGKTVRSVPVRGKTQQHSAVCTWIVQPYPS
jgi:hypothetical protein